MEPLFVDEIELMTPRSVEIAELKDPITRLIVNDVRPLPDIPEENLTRTDVSENQFVCSLSLPDTRAVFEISKVPAHRP